MSITTVSQEATPAVVGITYLALLTSFPPETVLGAFTGAVIFLLGVTHKPKIQWLMLFIVSFLTGILGGVTVADVITGVLHWIGIQSSVPAGMGAMVSSAVMVNLLSWFRDNPSYFFRRPRAED
ncbi:MAG: putative holin [Pseudomonas sp.]